MSNLHNDTILENLYETYLEKGEKELNLSGDELEQYADESTMLAFDQLGDAPDIDDLESRICNCGELIEECNEPYEHMTSGA